jgi:hypothetical protein
MRVSDALVLSCTLGAVACATQVPIDMSVLLASVDAGSADSGFGGIGNGNAGFSSEFGSFPSTMGGRSSLPAGGTAPIANTGGRTPTPMQNTGGRTTAPPPQQPTPPPPPANTGGRSGTGAGGATSNGGTPSSPGDCRASEKFCGGVCVSPGPKTGCGTTGCDPCSVTAPANGVVICNANHECDVSCLSGYTKNGNTCEAPPPPAPGTSTGSCPTSPRGCPDCGPVFGPGCCSTVNTGKCGCSPIPYTLGILGCI